MSELVNKWSCYLKVIVDLGKQKSRRKHLIRQLLRASGKDLVLCIAEVFHNIIHLSFDLNAWERELFVQRAEQVFELSALTGSRRDVETIILHWSLVRLGLEAALGALKQ